MKAKLLFIILIGITSLSYAQELQSLDNNKAIDYYAINKSNDSIVMEGEILPIQTIQKGLTFISETENKRINPNDFEYLLLKNSENKTFKLKSLPPKRKAINSGVKRNVFMTILIENSQRELEKGKLNLYLHEFISQKNDGHLDNIGYPSDYIAQKRIASGAPRLYNKGIKHKILYFQDLDGLHQIDSKSQFKNFPKILGKQLFKKMKKSTKDKEQFLRDYFTKYNMEIGKL